MKKYFVLFLLATIFCAKAQSIAILKYSGGGDWYSNPTALPNLIAFCNQHIQTTLNTKPEVITSKDESITKYPYVYMTGHGNVFFTEQESENIRKYLLAGGFLHIDDNYGMAPYLKKELKKIFPNKELEELSVDHPIFRQKYIFKNGLPKIHQHDGKRPQALGIFEKEKLMLLFTYESDLGDGWENPEIHNNSEEIRLKALQMGANIIEYAFKN